MVHQNDAICGFIFRQTGLVLNQCYQINLFLSTFPIFYLKYICSSCLEFMAIPGRRQIYHADSVKIDFKKSMIEKSLKISNKSL